MVAAAAAAAVVDVDVDVDVAVAVAVVVEHQVWLLQWYFQPCMLQLQRLGLVHLVYRFLLGSCRTPNRLHQLRYII